MFREATIAEITVIMLNFVGRARSTSLRLRIIIVGSFGGACSLQSWLRVGLRVSGLALLKNQPLRKMYCTRETAFPLGPFVEGFQDEKPKPYHHTVRALCSLCCGSCGLVPKHLVPHQDTCRSKGGNGSAIQVPPDKWVTQRTGTSSLKKLMCA